MNMRKIILNLAVSLDGYIEGPNGEYDWCFTDQDYGMKEFLYDTDTILFGRKSYELMESVEPHAYPGKQKIVFSTTMAESLEKGETLVVHDAVPFVRKIKNETGKNIWLFGGARVVTSLLNAGLIDELMLSVHPVILGSGKPLFSDVKDRVHLKLANTKAFSSGLVQLFYSIGK
jgi:dihydrofolate reductase